MKKYLMTGMAAVALCAAFTGCSKNENLYDPSAVDAMEESRIIESYNQAFIMTFGQPAANQDWGFGSVAGTRANQGETVPQTETRVNANANEWADPNKEFGGWVVPDPLTNGQKERVKAYFQANPNLGHQDPGYRNFFVQQVYKGGTSVGSNSTEKVIAADGSVYTSNNMNHLTVGQYEQHINNFNNGDCSEVNVLNNGQVVGGTSHKDKIMLMVNVDDTSCFGYHDSGSSNQSSANPNHNDKWALVSAATIDAWAAQNGNIGEAVNDKWGRSFLGFDLAIKEGAQAYARDNNGNVLYADYSQAPTSPIYGWDGQKVIQIGNNDASTGWKSVYWDGYQNIMKGIEAIGWLTTNKNFYIAADQITLTGEYSNGEIPQSALNNEALKNVLVFKDVQVPGAQNNKAHVINLKRIKELVDAGYLPVKDKSLQEWVKVGVSDGYYSDWIVTLTKAEKETTPPPSDGYDIRIIAEDLNAKALTAEAAKDGLVDSDWDFNDVVFDVKFTSETSANVKIVCAGGVLPLYVAGHEVHEALGRPETDADGLYKIIGMSNAATPFEVTGINKAKNGRDIKVEVKRTLTSGKEVLFELKAEKGLPAAKIGVKPKFTPCGERQDIRTIYPLFSKWVLGEVDAWYNVPD